MSNFVCLDGELDLADVADAVLGGSEILTGVLSVLLAIFELEIVELGVTAEELVEESSGGKGVSRRSSKLTAIWGLRNKGPDCFYGGGGGRGVRMNPESHRECEVGFLPVVKRDSLRECGIGHSAIQQDAASSPCRCRQTAVFALSRG